MNENELLGEIGIAKIIAIIAAIGALGTAAFSLVDATKAFNGGVSNVGLKILWAVLNRFKAALDRALGEGEWRAVVRAHWLNGRSRDQQKAIVKSLIRLGLDPETAPALAKSAHVSAAALTAVATKLSVGTPLTEVDLNVLGRLDASVEAQLDAAFDRAEQLYRNVARAVAGVVSLGLGLFATTVMGIEDYSPGILVGLLAVPLAPIAKDLASSLQAAATAVKATK
ncbi:MAG: hypothetical protein WEF50_06655 [Myxococcota bacterium]